MATISCDPSSLANAARCFLSCGTDQLAVKTYLLCHLSSGGCTPPGQVDNLISTAQTDTTITISWTAPIGTPAAASYAIRWGTVSGVYPFSGATASTSFTLTGLTPGTTYFIQVAAVSASLCAATPIGVLSQATTGSSALCASGVTFATAWAARVVVNGGTSPTQDTQDAIAEFQCGLITDNLYNSMVHWNAFVPDNFIATSTPQLLGPGTRDPYQNVGGMVAGSNLSGSGVFGNAVNQGLNTGVLASLAFPAVENEGMVVYVQPTATGITCGSGAIGLSWNELAAKYTDLTTYDRNGGSGTLINVASPGSGYYSSQRTGKTTHNLYFANSTTAHASIGSEGIDVTGVPLNFQTEMSVCVFNNGGVGLGQCSDIIGWWGVTLGLTSAQSALLFTRIQTLRARLLIADWANRVVVNGGAAPSTATKTALYNFQVGLIADGLDQQMLHWNAIASDNLIAALCPTYVGTGTRSIWTNSGPFVAGDLTAAGLKGDGIAKFSATGFAPSTSYSSDNDCGITIYLETNPNSNSCDTGIAQGANLFTLQPFAGTTYFDSYALAGRISAANAGFTGFISCNRVAGPTTSIYEANSGVAFNTLVTAASAPGGNRPTLEAYAWALNNGGAAGTFSDHRIGFVAYHHGLSAANAQLLYNRVQTLMTALGRQI